MTIQASVASIEVSTNTSTQRKSYALGLNKQEISIGRAPSNDIVIDEMVVSGFHLQIRRDGATGCAVDHHRTPPQQYCRTEPPAGVGQSRTPGTLRHDLPHC